MLLCETEINDEDLFIVLWEHKIWCFHVSVDEVSVMNLFDGLKHLDQKLNGYLEAVVYLKDFPYFSQIVAKKIHHNQILFTVFDEIVDIADMFKTLQTQEDVVLKYEDAFIFVFLLHFQSHFLLNLGIIGLIYETERALTKFLFYDKPVRNFQSLFDRHWLHLQILNRYLWLSWLLMRFRRWNWLLRPRIVDVKDIWDTLDLPARAHLHPTAIRW